MENIKVVTENWSIKQYDYGSLKGNAEDIKISEILNNNTDEKDWISAKVPGDVHVDLLTSGKIEDPFFSTNSLDARWVSEKDWCYKTKFIIDKSFLKDDISLTFEGIDTFSAIWLNDVFLGETNNMFKEFSFDISEVIKYNQENTLIVYVKSIRNELEKYPYQEYIGCFDVKRIFARKAQCHFGWDWAPDLPGTGIWGAVKLVSKNKEKIDAVKITTDLDGNVSFFVNTNLTRFIEICGKEEKRETGEKLEVLITFNNEVYKKTITITGDKSYVNFKIDNPKLWWPIGYGEPNLYEYSIKIINNNMVLDEKYGKFGIRSVKIIEKPLSDEEIGFKFNINNIDIYCKGSNWVPCECFTGCAKKEKYKKLIMLAKECNINMLRVWGGGIYERDMFYDMCDENGIMVWQDLMFACADIPDNHEWFVNESISEVEFQIKRLRNHASILYWCGGNEKTGAFGRKVFYGDKMVNYILRGVCNSLDNTRPYLASSPFSYTQEGNDFNSGDTHASCGEACVLNGAENFRDEIKKIKTTFNSESALQGSARYQSIIKFIPENKLWELNEIWDHHFMENPYSSLKSTFPKWQLKIAEDLFGKCINAKDFIKKSMTAHYELMKAEIEHHRSRKGQSGGFMFWMFSDIWPTGTWSVVDYYTLPKPVYYAVKKAYAPIVLVIVENDDGTVINIINDNLENQNCVVTYGEKDLSGNVIWTDTIENINVLKNSALKVKNITKDISLADDTYIYAELKIGGNTISNTTFFPKLWRNVKWQTPKITCEIISENKGRQDNYKYEKAVILTTDTYARMVNLNFENLENISFSDNFFDMEAGSAKVITISSDKDFDIKNMGIDNWLTDWS